MIRNPLDLGSPVKNIPQSGTELRFGFVPGPNQLNEKPKGCVGINGKMFAAS